MNTEIVRLTFLRGAATIALPIMAVCTPMVVGADKPDVADGEFWYPQGRTEYAGSTAAVVASAVMSVMPQVSGIPAFDSGIGDQVEAVLSSEFSSWHRGLCLSFR